MISSIKNRHILLGVPEYPPHHVWGGWPVFQSIAEWFRDKWFKVTVVYWYYLTDRDKISSYKRNGINFIEVPELNYPDKMPFLRTVMPISILNMFRLYKELQKIEFDKAYLHWYWLIFINQLSFILNILKLKYVYTLHGAPVSPSKIKWYISVAYKIYNLLLWSYTLRNAYKITAVSEYTKTFPEFKKYARDIIVINNWIEIEKYDNVKTLKDNILKIWRYKLLSLWRIEWLKWFQLVLPILRKMIDSWYECYYYIAWDDNGYKGELIKEIQSYNLEKYVIFLGYLDFEKKVNAIRECDILVVPSLVENYPAVPIEWLICWKVVMANNIWGIPEIVSQNEWICEDLSNTKLAYSKITDCIQWNSFFTKIERSKFNWDNIFDNYINL